MRTTTLFLIAAVGLVSGYLGAMLGKGTTPATPVRTASAPSAIDTARLDRIETELAHIRVAFRQQKAAARRDARIAARETDAAPAAAPSADAEQAAKAAFDALRRKVFASKATPDESSRFWEMARGSSLLPELIRDMRKRVKQDSEDIPARMELAQAYVARLYSVPNGPERGLWAAGAEKEWREVLKRDGGHWRAHFSLAMSLSQWPDFMNKTPKAISEFTSLRKTQETQVPAPQHVQTYLQLARLHRKQGQAEKSVEVLEAGLARHPRDAALLKTLESYE